MEEKLNTLKGWGSYKGHVITKVKNTEHGETIRGMKYQMLTDDEYPIGYGTIKITDESQKVVDSGVKADAYAGKVKEFFANNNMSGAIKTTPQGYPMYYATVAPNCKISSDKKELKAEPFTYKAPEYKYYISANMGGKPYLSCGKELILRKNLSDDRFAEVYSDKVVECDKEDSIYYEKMLADGEFMESPKGLTNKILGIIDNGYYVPRKHPEGFGKGKSKYCLERSDSGWESVIVSGRNPGINHAAGSNEAKECDEFVKSGEWILAEVEQVVEG